jgi:DNA mismatch repair protein MutL
MVLEGGKMVKLEKAAGRKGTDLTITDLFFNTPARLKYMKTVHTELGNITDVTNRLALAHPEVSIRLMHNERKLLHTNGNGDVRQVLAAVYGINIAKKMIPINVTSLDFKLDGYIALPEITRASRNYISTMINGRFIKNYPLVKAIQEGYHTLLPIGRYPIALLNIVMDPILVDVNVHPSKLEVRISKEHELNELVSETIKSAFKTRELIPAGVIREKTPKQQIEQTIMELDHIQINSLDGEREKVSKQQMNETSFSQLITPSREQGRMNSSRPFGNGEEKQLFVKGEVNRFVEAREPFYREEGNEQSESFSEEENKQSVIFTDKTPTGLITGKEEPSFVEEPLTNHALSQQATIKTSRVPPLYPIGQMHGTYIFAQNERGLYMIDQHAAQERIKYEYFKEKVAMVAHELQELLVPLTFEYSTDECVKIEEHQGELEKVGVFLEPFGYNSYIVKAHPQWFPKGEEKEIIEDMIEQLLSMKKVDIKKLREEAAIMMSCKGSIKANRHLRNDEIQALLDELRQTSDPFTCPHGRPIIIHTSVYELEKMFKRIM